MAWAEIEFSGVKCFRQGNVIRCPITADIEVGAVHDGLKVVSKTDRLSRGEQWELIVAEVKNDKPKARRTASKSREPVVDSASDDGRDSED